MGAGDIWPLADRRLVAAFDPKLPLEKKAHDLVTWKNAWPPQLGRP